MPDLDDNSTREALLNAPLDDEPLSEHEKAAWETDERRRQRGEAPIPHEEVLRELGITEADLIERNHAVAMLGRSGRDLSGQT